MKGEWKYIGIAISVYILAIPANGLIKLPIIGSKLQLPEMVSLVLFALTFFKVIKHQSWRKWHTTPIDKALIVYGLALTLSCLGHPTLASLFEIMGFLYLVVLYATINFYLIETGTNIRTLLVKSTQKSAILTATIGFLGLLLLIFGIVTRFVGYYENYPIFGNVYRTKALSSEPIMLISNQSVFTLIALGSALSEKKPLFSKQNIAFFSLLVVVMLFTYTKSIVMFGASAFVMLCMRYAVFEKIKGIAWGFVLTIFLFLSHFSFVSKTDFDQKKYFMGLESRPFKDLGDTYLVRTCYAVLKEADIITFLRYPLTGIGGGNMTNYTTELKKENLYPSDFVRYDPLSTYFGALSELGLIGFAALLFLYVTIGKAWKKICASTLLNEENRRFWLLIGGVLLFMIAEGFVTDTMNMRHYWVVLACLSAQERLLPPQ
jgi:hypothetical protein